MIGASFFYDALTLGLAVILLAVMQIPLAAGILLAVKWARHKKLSIVWLVVLICSLPLSVFVAMDTYILPEVSNPKMSDRYLEVIEKTDWKDENTLSKLGFVSYGEKYVLENDGYTVCIEKGNDFSDYAVTHTYEDMEYRALTLRNRILSVDRWFGEADYGYLNSYEFYTDGVTVSFEEEISSKKDTAFADFIESIEE